MKKQYSTVLLALICVAGLIGGARAEEGKVVVNIPYEFVAGGKTLPAGTYTVSRVAPETNRALAIQGTENSVYVLATTLDSAAAEHAKVSLKLVGDKYYLRKIETSLGVYTIATPKPLTKAARTKEQTGMYSGTN